MIHECMAAVTHQPGSPPTIETIQLRAPLPDEVLVRTLAAGVCGTDLHFAAGTFRYSYPTVLGHEASGVVELTGESVTWVKPGDRVIVCDQTFCGRCANCLTGRMVYCTDGQAKQRQRDRLHINGNPARQYLGVSAFAELMLVDENALITVPDGVSDAAAALLGCCLTTGASAIFNVARPRPGASVAVLGCGGVGLGAIQAARVAGAAAIIAVDPEAHRLAVAESFGATHLVASSTPGTETDRSTEAVLEITGTGVDIAIEAVGTAETAAQAFAMLAPAGHAIILGMLPPGADVVVPGRALRQGRRISGTIMGDVRSRADIPDLISLVRAGRLQVDQLATAHYPLPKTAQALADAATRRGIRTMIRP